jgi:hypothetical protein
VQVTVKNLGEIYPGKWYFTAEEFHGAICIPPDKSPKIKEGDVIEVDAHNSGPYWFANSVRIISSDIAGTFTNQIPPPTLAKILPLAFVVLLDALVIAVATGATRSQRKGEKYVVARLRRHAEPRKKNRDQGI